MAAFSSCSLVTLRFFATFGASSGRRSLRRSTGQGPNEISANDLRPAVKVLSYLIVRPDAMSHASAITAVLACWKRSAGQAIVHVTLVGIRGQQPQELFKGLLEAGQKWSRVEMVASTRVARG